MRADKVFRAGRQIKPQKQLTAHTGNIGSEYDAETDTTTVALNFMPLAGEPTADKRISVAFSYQGKKMTLAPQKVRLMLMDTVKEVRGEGGGKLVVLADGKEAFSVTMRYLGTMEGLVPNTLAELYGISITRNTLRELLRASSVEMRLAGTPYRLSRDNLEAIHDLESRITGEM